MIRLIVNADDLGCSPQRDRGILAAFAGGIVTSASLLANGASFTLAAAAARSRALPIGVHLNLSDGRPLTGPIPGLTDAAGNFPGKTPLRGILQGGAFDRPAAQRELLAQIERVRAAGIEPDHLDTHQHCLLFPALTGLVVAVARASGLAAMRMPQPAETEAEQATRPSHSHADAGGRVPCALGREALTAPLANATAGQATDFDKAPSSLPGVHGQPAGLPPAGSTLPDLCQDLALYRQLAPAARQTLQAAGLWLPDGLWGMPLLNRLDKTTLTTLLGNLPDGTWELMVHPGRCDPADPFGGPEREVELVALTAPDIRQLVARRGIRLTSFGACACAC